MEPIKIKKLVLNDGRTVRVVNVNGKWYTCESHITHEERGQNPAVEEKKPEKKKKATKKKKSAESKSDGSDEKEQNQ